MKQDLCTTCSYEYKFMACYILQWLWSLLTVKSYSPFTGTLVQRSTKQYPCTGRCGGPRGCSRLPSFSTLPTVTFWFCQERKDIVTSSVHNLFGLCGISTVYIFVFWYDENIDNELWSLYLFIFYLTGDKKEVGTEGYVISYARKLQVYAARFSKLEYSEYSFISLENF